MALILLQPELQPLGQYDAIDGYVTTILGGEVCTFTSVTIASDKAAADAADGYLNPGTSRVALTTNLLATGNGSTGPFYLTDDGTANYGTLFGTLVGGTVGQTSYGAASSVPASAQLGPHTAFGSGKWTAWKQNGLYGITLDAVDATTIAPTLASTNYPGQKLLAAGTATAKPGILTTTSSGAANGGATMANFVEFRTKGALVTTPNRLVSALNSPSSTVSGTLSSVLFMAVVNFNPTQS